MSTSPLLGPSKPPLAVPGAYWARYRYIDVLNRIDTRGAVETAYQHALDMLILCPVDNMGIRVLLPALMLRTDRDHECYDFLKWWLTTGSRSDYDWRDTNAFEPVGHLVVREVLDLALITALLILMIKLIRDLEALQNAANVPSINEMPAEVFNVIRSHVPRSPIISNSRIPNYTNAIEELNTQYLQFYTITHTVNIYWWDMLANPRPHLERWPPIHQRGSVEEVQLVLNYSYKAWVETGALELLNARIESGVWRVPIGDPGMYLESIAHNIKEPYVC